jgi:hypothetical protein
MIPKFREGWHLENPMESVLSTRFTAPAVVNVDDFPVVPFSHFSVKAFLTSFIIIKKRHYFHPLPCLRDIRPWSRRSSISGHSFAPQKKSVSRSLKTERTPLHLTSQEGHRVEQLLLEHGADAATQDQYGCTLLH